MRGGWIFQRSEVPPLVPITISNGFDRHADLSLSFPSSFLSPSLSASLSPPPHAIRSQKSRSDFSNYYFVSKALDPERLGFARGGLLIDCWPNVVSTLAAITVNFSNKGSVFWFLETIAFLINLVIIETEKGIIIP